MALHLRQRQPFELSLHDVQWLRYLGTGVRLSLLNKHPWKLKNRHVAYSSMALARINPNYLHGSYFKNTLSIRLTSFSLQILTRTYIHSHRQLKSRMCNIATPDSIRQCPWHWQRSNSEFLQLKKRKEKKNSRNMSMTASWIAWLST